MVHYITENFTVQNTEYFKQQLLQWTQTFSSCCVLNNNNYHNQYSSLEFIAAAGVEFECFATNTAQLNLFFQQHKQAYFFGHCNYEFTSITHKQGHVETTFFPLSYFFVPAIIIEVVSNTVTIKSSTTKPSNILATILAIHVGNKPNDVIVSMQALVSKERYITTVEAILKEIKRGNCYEMNYCIPFGTQATITPVAIFEALNTVSPNPFASFYKVGNNYLLCASPERYIKKHGNRLTSQPIKGTFKRHLQNPKADEIYKQQLQQSLKERTENVMVVDLVRNDLSRICQPGSVKVTELFGVYSFPQVHQMISTIEGTVNVEANFVDIVNATYPMGSMTGAPKHKVMELISKFELVERGIYSGTVGYISPSNDFDFNVVIRSLVYNTETNALQYHVGSGITANSIPENEYEECLLKATAMQQVLNME